MAGLLLGLLATACAVPEEVNPVAIYDRISGKADAARPVPPGMDQPFPNLASIPPRPERPSPEFRESVTSSLADDRARSREPLVLRSLAVPGATGGPVPGDAAMPSAPPRRPALAAAPAIPWSEAPAAPARPAARGTPDAGAPPAPPAAALPEMPAQAPAAPPPELLGPPPLPR